MSLFKLIGIFLFFTQLVFSQVVELKLNVLPNNIIETKVESENEILIDIVNANKEVMDTFKKRGQKFPSVMKQHTEMNILTESFLEDKFGNLPIKTVITNNETFYINNGKKIKIEDDSNRLKNLEMKMLQDKNGSIKILRIVSNTLKEQEKNTITKMMEQLYKLPLSNQEFKIGDSFTEKTPMQMPIEGMIIDMVQHTKYTLTKIESGKAYFDVAVSFDMNFSEKQLELNLEMNGYGLGELVYDINKQLDISNNLTTHLNAIMDAKIFKMDMKMTSKSMTRKYMKIKKL